MTPFRYLFSVLALVFAGVSTLPAQPLSKTVASKIDAALARDANEPGYAVAVYRNGKVVYAKGFGSADLEHRVPIAPQTRFDIGSTSKQFTAASLVLLALDGKLQLDDPISKYLPELPDYGEPITIRQMLNHTSGLRDYLGLMTMAGYDLDDVTTTEDALRLVAGQRGLEFPPGTEHTYSNTGYFLASVIVKRVSGKSLREFATERIFTPLGMTATSFIDDHTELLPNRAIGYTRDESGRYRRDVSNWEQNGDGGVFTTVEDLVKWDENFYTPKVGGAVLPAELQRWGLLKNGDTIGYGAGLMRARIGTFSAVAHGGAWGGYRAQLLRIPSEHISVAVLSNFDETNVDEIVRSALGPILGEEAVKRRGAKTPTTTPAPVAAPFRPELFDRYAGEYMLDEMPDLVLTFTREGKTYYAQATGQGKIEMVPSSDTTFFLKEVSASLTFHVQGSGPVEQLTLHQGGDLVAHRVAVDTVTRQLTAYTGSYQSSELQSRFTLVVEDGQLVAHHPRMATVTLKKVRGDHFTGSQWYLGSVTFEVGADGKAKAMLVSAGRNRDMRFERTAE